jgi:hypothetical protein
MRSLTVGSLVALSAAFIAVRPSDAQVCTGRPTSQTAPIHVGGRYISYPGSENEYGAEAGYAGASGTFASAAFSVTHVSDLDGNLKTAEMWLGQGIVDSSTGVEFCPIAGLQYFAFPDVNAVFVRVSSHALTYSLGGTLGVPFGPADPSLRFVPFGGVYFQHTQISVGGSTDSESFNNGMYEIGVMMTLNQRLSVGPIMRNVFAIQHEGRAAYGAIVSYNFGR